MTGSSFTGLKTDYVGSIDPDDISSAIFELVPALSGQQSVQFDISYLDDDGNEETFSTTLDIPIFDAGGVDVTLLYLVIIVLLVLVIYLWRRK
jgi:hypothetical protein